MMKRFTFASAALGVSLFATGAFADERPDTQPATGPIALTAEQMDAVTAAGNHPSQEGLVNVNVGDVTVQGNQLVVAVNAAVLGRSNQLVEAGN